MEGHPVTETLNRKIRMSLGEVGKPRLRGSMGLQSQADSLIKTSFLRHLVQSVSDQVRGVFRAASVIIFWLFLFQL